MYGPSMVNTSYQGAIVSVYNAGQAIGGFTVGYLADKYSRKYTILIASVLSEHKHTHLLLFAASN